MQICCKDAQPDEPCWRSVANLVWYSTRQCIDHWSGTECSSLLCFGNVSCNKISPDIRRVFTWTSSRWATVCSNLNIAIHRSPFTSAYTEPSALLVRKGLPERLVENPTILLQHLESCLTQGLESLLCSTEILSQLWLIMAKNIYCLFLWS